MNLFGWLLLGHFVADWLLQSDWMAIGKRQRFFSRAGIVHYTVYTLTILFFLYWGSPPRPPITTPSSVEITLTTIWIAFWVFLSHWLIDGTNLIHGWMRLVRQRHQTIVYLVIDQTLHLLILGMVAAFLTQPCITSPRVKSKQYNMFCMTKDSIAQVAHWIDGEKPPGNYLRFKSE